MFRSSALVTLLSLGASALGFMVQLLLAKRYGISVDVDAYLFALSVPTFIAGVVSALLSYELVPRLIAVEKDENYQKRYMSSLLIGVISLSLLLGVVGGTIGMQQSQVLPISSPIRVYEDLPHLIFLAWAIGTSQIIQGCLTAMLNAHRRYMAGAILALFPYLGMILLLLFLDRSAGISALPLGMLVGTIAATLGGLFLLRHHLFPLPLRGLLWSEMRELACSSPLTAVAMTCFSSYAVVDAYWAPHAGHGALATLGYAQRLIIALGNLAVAGPSAVLVPRFAELVREKDFPGFRRFLLRTLMVVGGISAGVALAMTVFANELVELLFAKGSFGSVEVMAVAQTLRHMAPGMVGMLLSVIILRALFCLDGAAKVAAILGLLWTVAYFGMSGFLNYQGAPGLALGYSIVWIFFFLIIAFVIFRKVPNC